MSGTRDFASQRFSAIVRSCLPFVSSVLSLHRDVENTLEAIFSQLPREKIERFEVKDIELKKKETGVEASFAATLSRIAAIVRIRRLQGVERKKKTFLNDSTLVGSPRSRFNFAGDKTSRRMTSTSFSMRRYRNDSIPFLDFSFCFLLIPRKQSTAGNNNLSFPS